MNTNTAAKLSTTGCKDIPPISNLPMWAPWVVVNVQSNDNIPAGRAVRLGNSMTKRNAWAVARREMETRPEVVAMAVRRDGESF